MQKYILGVVMFAVAFTCAGCGTTSQNTSTQDNPPVLFNLGGVNVHTDVEFNAQTLDIAHGKNVAVFLFGQPLPQNPGELQRINPNIEFGGITTPIELVSAINGIVGFIREQPESNDYEVFLQTHEGSQWVVGYDHVTDVRVQKGQNISVGDVLGLAAQEHSGYYRYELQINHESADDTRMYCPTDLLDDSVKAETVAALNTFVEHWNTQYRAVFNTDAYTTQSGGCIKPYITTAESEGR